LISSLAPFRWEVPLGLILQLSSLPQSSERGSINLGGPLTTGGGLVIIAAAMDETLRAFEVETAGSCGKGRFPQARRRRP
jgi:quinoprotein glucose dehydrogenase